MINICDLTVNYNINLMSKIRSNFSLFPYYHDVAINTRAYSEIISLPGNDFIYIYFRIINVFMMKYFAPRNHDFFLFSFTFWEYIKKHNK